MPITTSDIRATTTVRESIGYRLAEERVSRRMSQDELARAVGKTRRAVAAWEAGDATPDAEALHMADSAGLDVLYVVTGRRGGVLTAQESLLVSYVREAPPPVINAALQTVEVMSKLSRGVDFAVADQSGVTHLVEAKATAPSAAPNLTFNADVHQAIGRDLHTQSNVLHAMENPAVSKPRRPRK